MPNDSIKLSHWITGWYMGVVEGNKYHCGPFLVDAVSRGADAGWRDLSGADVNMLLDAVTWWRRAVQASEMRVVGGLGGWGRA